MCVCVSFQPNPATSSVYRSPLPEEPSPPLCEPGNFTQCSTIGLARRK